MIRRTFEISDIEPHELASIVASADNEYQAEFLEVLCRKFGEFGAYKSDLQMLWVKDKLSTKAKEFIKKLNEHINEE